MIAHLSAASAAAGRLGVGPLVRQGAVIPLPSSFPRAPPSSEAAPLGVRSGPLTAVRKVYRKVRPKVAEVGGMRVNYISKPDVKFLHHEIFEERCYERFGVALGPGDTVLDVGANIGMFALYCAQVCGPEGRVVSFEPIPETFEALRENVARQKGEGGGALADVTAINAGVSDGASSEAEFTFYTRAAGWTSMYPSSDATRADVAAFFDNSLQDMKGLDASPLVRVGRWAQASGPRWAYVGLRSVVTLYLLGGRRTVRCRLVSVSGAMREQGVTRVDLLKIDVERAELDVLRGVEAGDWGRIRQVAAEVHDVEGRLSKVVKILEGQGFEVKVEQPPELRGSALWNLYATQGQGEAPMLPP